MIQSFSAKGHPYDNAVMECFFKYLKKEEVNRKTYSSFDDLNLCLFKYIYGFYNSKRPHSHNNGLAPNAAEENFFLSSLFSVHFIDYDPRFPDLCPDPHRRIQGRGWVLHDNAHFLTPHGLQRRLLDVEQILSFIQDLTVYHDLVFDQMQNCTAEY